MLLLLSCSTPDDRDENADADGFLTPDSYLSRFAHVYCAKFEECEESFSATYDDVDECAGDLTRQLEAFEDCALNEEAAQACLDRLENADCGSWATENDRVCNLDGILSC